MTTGHSTTYFYFKCYAVNGGESNHLVSHATHNSAQSLLTLICSLLFQMECGSFVAGSFIIGLFI